MSCLNYQSTRCRESKKSHNDCMTTHTVLVYTQGQYLFIHEVLIIKYTPRL